MSQIDSVATVFALPPALRFEENIASSHTCSGRDFARCQALKACMKCTDGRHMQCVDSYMLAIIIAMMNHVFILQFRLNLDKHKMSRPEGYVLRTYWHD